MEVLILIVVILILLIALFGGNNKDNLNDSGKDLNSGTKGGATRGDSDDCVESWDSCTGETSIYPKGTTFDLCTGDPEYPSNKGNTCDYDDC